VAGLTSLLRFYKKPDYDIDVVEYADANKQPFAIAEIVRLSAPPGPLFNFVPITFMGTAIVRQLIVWLSMISTN